jgi:hypothetical protein
MDILECNQASGGCVAFVHVEANRADGSRPMLLLNPEVVLPYDHWRP